MKQKNVNAHHQGYKQYGGKYGQRSVEGNYHNSITRGGTNNIAR